MLYPSYHVPKPDLTKGVIFILIAYLFLALFGVMTKIAIESMPQLWFSFFTYLSGFIILIPYAIYNKYNIFEPKYLGYHFCRAFFGLSASLMYMWSLQKISIVNATLLFNTAPIFIPIFAIFWWNRKISTSTWCAIGLGFLGIIFIIRPTTAILEQSGSLIGLASGISLAIAYMFVKELTNYVEPMKILFYFFGISTLLQLPFLFFVDPITNLYAIGYAVINGLFFILAQNFLVKAYEYAEASKVGVFQYSSVIFVGIINWLLWDKIPNNWALFGSLLVILAGGFVIRGTHVKEPHPLKIK